MQIPLLLLLLLLRSSQAASKKDDVKGMLLSREKPVDTIGYTAATATQTLQRTICTQNIEKL